MATLVGWVVGMNMLLLLFWAAYLAQIGIGVGTLYYGAGAAAVAIAWLCVGWLSRLAWEIVAS